MVKENRISVRVGPSYELVKTMAAALSTEAAAVSASDVVRTLLAEAATARQSDCAGGHLGPVKASACGHCGRHI